MTGSKAFAVHDANAGKTSQITVAKKSAQCIPGFGDRHAVQVDLSLHAEIAAGQFAQRSFTDGWTAKSQAFASTGFGFIDIGRQAFLQRRFFVLAREMCLCTDPGPLPGHRLAWPQRFRIAHQAAKKA